MTSSDNNRLSRGNDARSYVSPDGEYQHCHRPCPTCGGDALETARKLYTSRGEKYGTWLTLDCFDCGPREKMISADQEVELWPAT